MMAPHVGPHFCFLTFWPIPAGLNAKQAASLPLERGVAGQ